MFFGSYNRGRQSAGGITNLYAADASLCPSGQRHQPKFSHYASLHQTVAAVAPTLLSAESALKNSRQVRIQSDDGQWVIGKEQRMFEYIVNESNYDVSLFEDGGKFKHVMFVENDANKKVLVEIHSVHSAKNQSFSLDPLSAIIVVDGKLEFDSFAIDPQFMSFKREFVQDSSAPLLLDWSTWAEPIGVDQSDAWTRTGPKPIEQTHLNVKASISSDYAWYETSFSIEDTEKKATLFVDSQRSNALIVCIDDQFVGATEDHSHLYEGNITMKINIGNLVRGNHKLSILSESFGYSNLIGRFGNSETGPKTKGITGDVLLLLQNRSKNFSLVDGRDWMSFPGLHGESLQKQYLSWQNAFSHLSAPGLLGQGYPTWYSTLFDSPTYDPIAKGLFLQITTGRGHIWLNGKDLGRYWNITRGQTDTYTYTQKYYFLPADYLRSDGKLNEIIMFDAFGSSHPKSTSLILSGIIASDYPNFEDQVSYPLACI